MHDTESDNNYRRFNSVACLDSEYDSLLEIGAGTGGFTLGLLSNTVVKHAVISDISLKLLCSCTSKLNNPSNVALITHSGVEDIFKKNTFDLIIGNYTLHHILDIKQLFGLLEKAIKNDGKIIFVEPNRLFHSAIIDVFLEVIKYYCHEARLDGDLQKLASWISEINYNLKYSGDLSALAEQEDKHMFDNNNIAEYLTNTNLSYHLHPYGNDDYGFSAAEVYLGQLKLSDYAYTLFMDAFRVRAAEHFQRLGPDYRTDSNVIILQRNSDDNVAKYNGLINPLPVTEKLPPFDFVHGFMSITINGDMINFRGWAFN